MNLIFFYYGIYLIEEILVKLEGLGFSISLLFNQLCDYLVYIYLLGIFESLCVRRWKYISEVKIKIFVFMIRFSELFNF